MQSVTVRLIVEREKEIKAFKSEPYYRVVAQMIPEGNTAVVNAELNKRLANEQEAMALLEACKQATFTVSDVTVKPVKKSPAPPFTTSTLQQEASRKLGFSVSQTMMVAQKLYESGYITYMRTDSLNLSSLAINTISNEIKQQIGEEYLKVRKYHTSSKGAQEAHEAIRPTYIDRHEISGTSQEKKLYNLIWKRTIASQMADAVLEKTSVDIAVSNRSEKFIATGEVVKFDGFLKVYMESSDDDNAENATDVNMLPPMHEGMAMAADSITATQRFTQHPSRYTEATLVKKLEELGIGRPSTYATIITTIQNREYVERGDKPGEKREFNVLTLKKGAIKSSTKSENTGNEKGKLLPTDIGMIVNDFLQEYFPSIMDYNFTAIVEGTFDEIAEGNEKWSDGIGSFYKTFHPDVEKVSNLRLERKVGERILGNDPKTGRPVSVKIGRFGPVVQLGSADDDEKPQFASLQKEQSINSLTLEQALKLFELPRDLGEFEGEMITAAVGRFGPYLKHAGKFVSIPAGMAPETITLEEAQQLIVDKRESEAKKVLRTFDEEPELEVLNGRFGVYIAYKKKNYKIPKGVDVETITLADCMKIVEDEGNAPKKKVVRRKATTAKKK